VLNPGVGELRKILIDNIESLKMIVLIISDENVSNISAASLYVSIVGIVRAWGAVLSMPKHCFLFIAFLYYMIGF